MDNTSIQVFSSQEFGELRALKGSDGEPWFVAKDVCDFLEITNRNRAMQRLDDDEKGGTHMYTPGGKQEVRLISEAGFYNLLFLFEPTKANKATREQLLAWETKVERIKRFKRWVTHDVLPAIRQSGGYIATDGSESNEDLLARAVLVANEAIQRKDAQLKEQQRQLYEKDTTIIEQGARIDELAPKAGVYDTVISVKGTMTITDAARYLAQYDPLMNRRRLFALLRADGMICQGSNAPTKRGIETGRFVQIMSTRRDGKSNEPYARMTQKGFDWCVTAYCTTPLVD